MTFVVAPGAGTSCAHPSVTAWVARLARHGPVVSVDYPYRKAGRGRPDPQPVLVAAHVDAIEEARAAYGDPVVAVGRSMGGRIGCHASVEGAPIAALICLGYPLFGQGDPAKPRDVVLRALRTPVLFVQGTRDAMCPLDALAAVRAAMAAPSELHVVEGGDHGLAVPRRAGPQEAVDDAVEAAMLRFLDAVIPR